MFVSESNVCKNCGKPCCGDFCCFNCRTAYHDKTFNERTLVDGYYVCKECGDKLDIGHRLTRHINKFHKDIGLEGYYRKHVMRNGDPDGHCLWCGEKLKFVNLKEGYKKFCYNKSCNVKWYNKHSDRKELASKNSKITFSKGESCDTQVGFWLKKGFTEEEAKIKIRERQTTNSVEKIMKRNGCTLEEAKKIRQEITNKWCKSFKKQNFSKVSQKLFWKIWENIKNEFSEDDVFFATFKSGNINEDGTNLEFRVKTKEHVRKLDFYIKSLNKIIEFDGAYWHGKEKRKLYQHASLDLDKIRDDELIETMNCKILHIEEMNFYNLEEETINKCLKFIRE